MFPIKFCSGDQYSKVMVLATRNPRYEESIEINLMHTLLDPLDLSLPLAWDKQSLGLGACWWSISDDFDHQHYSRIHGYKAYTKLN
jgi:hypothetical protein